MVLAIISEIKTALMDKLYFIALLAALTLPDVCGKAEYPNNKPTNRYKKWVKAYIEKRKWPNYEHSCPDEINANIIYSLRCSMLHQNTPNTDVVDYFELVQVDSDRANIFKYTAESETLCENGIERRVVRKISINISELCYLLCDSAEEYYRNNKEKFGFINYNFVNVDYHTAKVFGITHNKMEEKQLKHSCRNQEISRLRQE